MKKFFHLLLLSTPLITHAISWDDLWLTKNQQAQRLMEKNQFAEASHRFTDNHWSATAAYRAGQYQDAASGYQTLDTEEGYYNQGNALAQLHQYEKAIKAYDNALKRNPNHKDAKYNRDLVEKLLNKQQQKQDKQQQDKQQQDKQQQDKQQQDKQQQDKQQQDKQQQDKQQQDKQQQDKQQQDKQQQDKQQQDKQKQDKQQQDKQQQDKQQQDKQQQDKQQQDKQKQDKQDQDKQNQDKDKQSAPISSAEKEKQRAKDQWLRLIPDDPGGLMREKFLRDHLRS